MIGFLPASANGQTAEPLGTSQLLFDTIPAPSLAGNLFGDPTRQPIVIYLPPSYSTTKNRYPVVYFLPGFGDPMSLYLDGTYQGFKLQAAMDSLIGAGVIKEMIVVVINGRNSLGGSFYVDSPVTGNWETFIAAGIVTFIDSHYRTILWQGSRAIAGHSMGGYGAINLGLRHPDIFGCVYAMSPGLCAEDGISQSPMFANQQTIRDYLAIESSLKTLSRPEATARFSSLFDSLLTSGRWDLIFTFAYGTAFAPRPGANAPHIEYPYLMRNDSLVLDSAAWKRWEAGFGALAEKIDQYRGMPERLRAIGIEFGERDENGWIPDGCRYLSQLLNEQKIQHQLITFSGAHQDSLGMRLAGFMLPFCSDNLQMQKNGKSRSSTSTTKKTTKSKKK